MAAQIGIHTSARRGGLLKKIPWTLTVIAYMVLVDMTNMDMAGVPGYIFIGLCLFVLFMEFYKSSDINVRAFLTDLITAVISVIIATALMAYLILESDKSP